jgi:hypothetical protein
MGTVYCFARKKLEPVGPIFARREILLAERSIFCRKGGDACQP